MFYKICTTWNLSVDIHSIVVFQSVLFILVAYIRTQDYFKYIQRCNLLGEAGKQSNVLQLEWERVKKLCVKVKGGEAQAGRVFW